MNARRLAGELKFATVCLVAMILIAALPGCASNPTHTTPSPEQDIAEGNAQLRAHWTRAAGGAQVESGVLAAPYANTEAGAQGDADGCTITTLGTLPAGIYARARLVRGKNYCEAVHGSPPGTDDDTPTYPQPETE